MPPMRWQGEDEVFFHKSQIAVGVRLINFGRKAHGEMWEVVEIKSYRMSRTGRVMGRKVDQVIKLSDDVTVRAIGRNEIRQLSFSTLSYSAIWRVA